MLTCSNVINDLDVSGEDEVIENSYQRTPLAGADNLSLPEKIGEVVASLHILLVA